MSCKVRARLKALGLYLKTTHEDRVAIDKEIERRKNKNCDEAMERGLVTDEEFREIVEMILRRKKKRKEPIPVVV